MALYFNDHYLKNRNILRNACNENNVLVFHSSCRLYTLLSKNYN